MKPVERFLTALNGGTPDRVPIYEHLFSRAHQKELLGYSTELYDGEALAKIAEKYGIDCIWAPINGFCGIEDIVHAENEIYQDEWGITYKKNGWPIIAQVDTPIKSREDWNQYVMPEPNTEGRLKILKDTVRANEGELAVVLGLLGPLTMMTWYFMDFENFSMSLFMDPDLVHEMNDAFVDWTLKVAQLAVDSGGVDAFQISDDWGGTNGLLISPEHCREFFIKPFERMVQGLKSLGKPVIMHNDGQIWDVLDDLVATGINGFHPVERDAGMDLKKVKEAYDGKLCPVGNVNNKTTMVNGSPQDVREETLECLRIAAPGGGYIIATDHSLHDDIPLENVFALVDTVKEFGKYPIDISNF
jgi:uroporphyrinogen decarboxylase